MKGFNLGSGMAYAGVCIAGAGIVICQLCIGVPWWAYIFPSLMMIAGTNAIEDRIPKQEEVRVSCRIIPACQWTEDPDGIWYTSCGQAHEFNTGTPEENDHLYCPYCGNVLETKERKDEV